MGLTREDLEALAREWEGAGNLTTLREALKAAGVEMPDGQA